MTDRTCDHDTDRIADELRSLIEAAARRAAEYLRRDEAPGTCEPCPLCAVLAMAKGEHSEWTGKLGARLASFLAALREVVAAGPDAEREAGAGTEPEAGRREGVAVRRIDVRRVNGTVLNESDPPFDGATHSRAAGSGC